MNLLLYIIDVILHMDKYLAQIIHDYGTWTYLLLFFMIFMETGFVITPFLPGDSLLFAAGTFASPALALAGSKPPLNIWLVWLLLCFAAVLGDTVNYWIGHAIGPRAFSGEIRFLKKEYLDRTHAFYEKHGGITIIIARFIPIIRTFAPFVAGVGEMTYGRFISFNIIGGIAWVTLFTFGGYFFGNLSFVKDNFSFVILAIIFISVLPAIIEFIRGRMKPDQEPQTPTND
jgi:membrane-associated protein